MKNMFFLAEQDGHILLCSYVCIHFMFLAVNLQPYKNTHLRGAIFATVYRCVKYKQSHLISMQS